MTNHPNPNSAAQAAEQEAVRRVLEPYAESYDMMTRMAQREGNRPIVSTTAVAIDIRGNMIPGVIDALSKLRAPASSIREAFELTYAADADDPASATELSHFTNGWRACVMSQVRAPVAGEAQPVACLRRQRVRSDWGHWAPGTVEDGQRVTGLRSWQVRWLVDAAPQASAEPATYTTCPGESVMGIALRELGNEKAWRHILACNPQFADLLPHEYFPVGTVLTLPQAPQNVRPCSCPSGDGSLRHPCAVHQASEAVRDAGIAASEDVVLPPLPEALALQPGQLGHTDQTLDYFARAAVLADRQQRADRSQVARNECDCATCRPHSVEMRMILCSICGDKRCPHAADHRNACTATQPEQGERDA